MPVAAPPAKLKPLAAPLAAAGAPNAAGAAPKAGAADPNGDWWQSASRSAS